MKEQSRHAKIWLTIITLSFAFIVMLGLPAKAAYVRDMPLTLTQPDGESLNCFTSGDEFYHWLHDADGYIIIKDSRTGYYVYASKSNDDIQPTPYVPGKANPQALGLTKDAKPSPQKMEEINARRAIMSEGERRPAPSIGTVNNIAVFIRFSDESEFIDPISAYDNMFNSTATGANSMKNYYMEASYDQSIIITTFYPARSGTTVVSYQDSHPRSYYQPYDVTDNPGGYTLDERTEREHTLLANTVNAIALQVPPDLDVDSDDDGEVDNVCFMVSGGADEWNDLLWPHMWVLYSQDAYINGKQVYTYNFQLRNFLIQRGVGVLCHEMFHSMGSPDLYHYSYDGLNPVWTWDIMEADSNPPQHMGAYMKYRYGGWIDSIPEITASGTYALNPLTSSTGNCYKIASPNSTTEYYVVEYRKKSGTFENSLPGSGLLVYRINTNEDGYGNAYGPPDEVYIYRLGGTVSANGNPNNANFSSNVGRTAINDYTNPSGFLSDGSAGGLELSAIGAAGSTISFTFTTRNTTIPEFDPDGGTFTSSVDVTISCATVGATIHYTIDGSDPTGGDPTIASGGIITIDSTLTLKAKAWSTGLNPSAVKSADYTKVAETPTFSPDGGISPSPIDVTVSCATVGATIHYTTNGYIPDEDDPTIANGGTVTITSSCLLVAKAWAPGVDPSNYKYAYYTITGTVPTPTFSPDGGTHVSSANVTVSCSLTGVTIHYTTTGVDPTESDPTVANGGTITLPSSVTLKAKAWKSNWNPSEVKSAAFVIRGPIAIHIKSDGLDTNNGLSWATAKQTVQASINAAVAGDEIWVKAGTYTGCIMLKSRVNIYGGFAGNETARSKRPAFPRSAPDPNETILDGGGLGSVVTAPVGLTSTDVIDGFTIRNGSASSGGGIYCGYSSPTISNNTISGNSVSQYGGGIYCTNNSSPIIQNNTITGNSAPYGGGGIYCDHSAPTISNNTITGNSSLQHGGGGISCGFSSSPAISNNAITGNTAAQGAGIACYSSSTPAITRNTITGNTALTNYGGGIYCYYAAPTVTSNIIKENTAPKGGGIGCYYSSTPLLVNNTIIGNIASAGGGIYTLCSTTIANNIIASNSSGILRASGIPVLQNNCVYGNTGYNYSGLESASYATDIQQDPLFVDEADGNYHIQPDSPCEGAGNNTAVPAGSKDIDNQPRIQGANADIGADEIEKHTFDINGDGNDDLVGLSSGGSIYYSANKTSWTNIPGTLSKLAVGDLNGDGVDDLAGLTSSGSVYYTTNKSTWTKISGSMASLAVGDFNGDGYDDIAGITPTNKVYYTTDGLTWTNIPGTLTALYVGDFDGDGVDDLAGLNSSGSVYYTTDKSTWTKISGTMASLVIGDFNGDGYDDIAGLASSNKVYYTGNLSTWTNIPGALTALFAGDFDGDGVDDLAGLTSPGAIYYSTNKNTWTKISGVMANLAAGDFDGDGYDDIAGLSSSGKAYYTTDKSTWTNISGTLTKLYSGR